MYHIKSLKSISAANICPTCTTCFEICSSDLRTQGEAASLGERACLHLRSHRDVKGLCLQSSRSFKAVLEMFK